MGDHGYGLALWAIDTSCINYAEGAFILYKYVSVSISYPNVQIHLRKVEI